MYTHDMEFENHKAEGRMIRWTVTKEDAHKIIDVMLRAASCMSFEQYGLDRLTVSMDIQACHANGCELDLDGLLAADKLDFIHDVSGIITNIDRKTGALENCFMPRYAKANHVEQL